MPLSESDLEQALYVAFSSPTDNFNVAAQRLAHAYISYGRHATSCQGASPLPAAMDAAEATLRTALSGIYATSKTLPQTIQQLATAFSLVWLLPPIPFQDGATPGLVTISTPTAFAGFLTVALVGNAARAVSGENIGARQAARAMAQALNSATKTVWVTHSPPAICSSPLV